MLNPKLVLILLFAVAAATRPISLVGQSPFNTGDATGSITTPAGGFLQVDFSKQKFRLGYAQELLQAAEKITSDIHRYSERPRLIPRYGVEFEARGSGNSAPLFGSSNLAVGAKVTLSAGFSNLLTHLPSQEDFDSLASKIPRFAPGLLMLKTEVETAQANFLATRKTGDVQATLRAEERVSKARYSLDSLQSIVDEPPDPGPGSMTFDWLTLRVSYDRDQYTLLDETASFPDQITAQRFNGYSALLSYNAQFGGLPRVLGLSLGIDRKNNTGDLQQVEVHDQLFASTNGTTSRTGQTIRKVLRGSYEEFTSVTFNTDYVVLPPMLDARIAFDVFTRNELSRGSTTFRPGFGTFLTEQGAPTKVIGGVSLYRGDDGKLAIDLVAGFNF